jgi:D-alanine-D-alanine ligase
MRIRVGVIFGGRSGEHEVSVRSAAAVIENIDKEKYEPVPVAITHDGAWLSPRASIALLPEKVHRSFSTEATDGEFALIGDTSYNGLTSLIPETENVGIDVAFPVLHGTFGEDGTIQGLLEMADLPYVGCGVLASSCGMDKLVMKSLFQQAGLSQCKYSWLLRRDYEADQDAVVRRIESEIGFPAFVKPANLGSSVGVSRAENATELKAAIEEAAKFDRKIIVEEALKMREIECGVLGNDEPLASRPGEYVIRDKSKAFLDYTEKYAGTGNNEFVVPAAVSAELEAKIREMSVTAFKAIDGSGLARVDFFLRTDNGMLLINEINTMPGLTDASGFPKMWAGSGVSFSEVIDQLISLAIERHADRSRNLTSR